MAAERLLIWVVYHRPRDLPGVEYAARAQWAEPGGVIAKAAEHLEAPTLAAIRAALPPGLACIGREPGDDPVIVECWI